MMMMMMMMMTISVPSLAILVSAVLVLRADRQTDAQTDRITDRFTDADLRYTRATAVCVSNDEHIN